MKERKREAQKKYFFKKKNVFVNGINLHLKLHYSQI
jgi:hypothetical protein